MPTVRDGTTPHGSDLPAGGKDKLQSELHGELKSDLPLSEPEASGSLRDVIIDTRTFGIRLADTEEGRNSASLLINKMYAWRGYASAHRIEAHPNRITLAASEKGNTIGTVTLGIDSPAGILADEIFRDQVDGLRLSGARVCEITKLAFDHTVRSKGALAALFHTVFIYSYHIHRCTHALIEVNPRHRRFYEHMMGFRRLGDVRENPRVQAPAYLLAIELAEMAERIRELGGTAERPGSQAQRSLYPYFFSQREEDGIVHRLLAMS
ncbi:hypothetical protein IP91_03835 [Pseudoduganella lurida]|uniref:N-acetyltransferase domain-containing protein n=1 Tax=Pseudoduganella lurida TaxID=1036180 RepID=A0A562R1N7_9BURK|nr:GNAT family N-acetyltransferase [Pseudoduganella lurida]TWI62995.1 hypothetical protein IP91_03835 [Pseudoduganella lurida]